ncbi:MAG: elongation factor P [Eubacterium sp.]|nr:elongation factor P [Eubacterium sp.]
MISAGEIRNGVTVEIEGNIFQVIEFMHVKPGKGAAFVRTKLKNIKNGGVVEKTFRPTEKLETAHIEKREMTYSYKDGELFYFMDPDTFDMVPVSEALISDDMKFVKENESCKISSYKGEVFSIEPPINVILLVTECEPGVAGNTATNATKPCTVETGATLNVPLFVNQGDSIKIDTRTGEYISRV